MPAFAVSRAHLKSACDARNWDLLDRLLELDARHINDNSLYTDTWGTWWGLLMETVQCGEVDGVRVLLKHGADAGLACWGDGMTVTPLEAAAGKPEITALLLDPGRAEYVRTADPPLPQGETAEQQAVNKQGEVRDATGMVFQIPPPRPNE